MTKVVNKKNHIPTKDDVYIGRGSKWGNPFPMKVESDREEVLQLYREHLSNSPNLLNALSELEGKTLVCFCKPKKCHGDILIELLEKRK